MRTVARYRQLAEDCRAMARHMSLDVERGRLLKMAEEWDDLATEREAQLRRQARQLDGMPWPDRDKQKP